MVNIYIHVPDIFDIDHILRVHEYPSERKYSHYYVKTYFNDPLTDSNGWYLHNI